MKGANEIMKDIVLQPTFYDKFSCLGSDCKNNCCTDWTIYFTKDEFRNIKRKMHSEEFKNIFQDAFEFKKGENDRCTIKFDENKNCKFLDENGLCKIYQEVGPENMSWVCQIYPRIGIHYLDNYEIFLSVSCEEVINLLLEEKDGIMLEIKERELSPAEKKGCAYIRQYGIEKNPIFYFWNDSKILLMSVLQNRDYTFSERMILLGFAVQKIQEMVDNKKYSDVPEYIQTFARELDQNKEIYKQFFDKTEKDNKRRALQTIIYYLSACEASVQKKVVERIDLKKKFRVVTSTKDQEQKKLNMDVEYNTQKYADAVAEFNEFLKGKEYWLENIILEGFLATKGLYRIGGGFWHNYAGMVMIYSAYLFLLSCCVHKDSTKEEFVYYAAEIGRTMFHDDKVLKSLEDHLKETESDTLAHLAILAL